MDVRLICFKHLLFCLHMFHVLLDSVSEQKRLPRKKQKVSYPRARTAAVVPRRRAVGGGHGSGVLPRKNGVHALAGDVSASEAHTDESSSHSDSDHHRNGIVEEQEETDVEDGDSTNRSESSDPDDSGVDTEADPEYLDALTRSLDKCSQVRSRGDRLLLRNKRKIGETAQ